MKKIDNVPSALLKFVKYLEFNIFISCEYREMNTINFMFM